MCVAPRHIYSGMRIYLEQIGRSLMPIDLMPNDVMPNDLMPNDLELSQKARLGVDNSNCRLICQSVLTARCVCESLLRI